MKERIAQCTVQYTSWEMECCGNPIRMGQIVNLSCIKGEPYTCSCGVEIGYCEEHHGMGANCMIRGKVTRIRTVFAESSDCSNIIDVDDPENIYTIFDVSYIDGWEKPDCYGGRENKSYYIITVENAIECLLDGHAEYDEELHVSMEADSYSDEVFSHMGTVDRLKLYSGRKTKKIYLTQFAWHKDLVEWNNEYKDNRPDNDTDELKWWSKGWAVAKEIRKILPKDIEFVYDATIFEIMDGKTLFTTTIPNNMQKKNRRRIVHSRFAR
ncbi:MAG: hypothetical protein IKR18_10970 [Bacteroidaceae bacterium]|nr:hypothetical protein [Bacteroidaceae bacterium]